MSEPDSKPNDGGATGPTWHSDVDAREAKRRKMLVFGGAAVAVLVGFVGLYAALSWIAGSLTSDPTIPSPRADAAAPPEAAGPAPTVVIAEPVEAAADLDWYAIEAPLGFASRLFATEAGTFYALSTVPGQAINWPVPNAIYKSADGENWDIISLDNTISATDMAASGGSLYLIGTGPSNRDIDEAPEVMVSTSTDDGNSWTETLLPTVAAPPGGAPIQWANVNMRIGATPDAVVATVHSQYFLDYSRMVPAEFAGGEFGYQPTADGVEVIDHRIMEEMYMECERELGAGLGEEDAISAECQALFNGDQSAGSIGFVTWGEMGLADGTEPVFSELFVSADGIEFEAVDSPFAPGTDIQGLFATDEGFIAVEWQAGRQSIWTSADGVTWARDDTLQQFDWIANAGSFQGRRIIVGQGANGALAAWEDESGGWEMVDFNAILGAMPANAGRWLSSSGIGPMGIVAVFQSFDERTERDFTEVVLGTAPDTWSIVPLQDVTGMAGGYSDWVTVGTDEILIRYQVFGRNRPINLQVIGVRPTA